MENFLPKTITPKSNKKLPLENKRTLMLPNQIEFRFLLSVHSIAEDKENTIQYLSAVIQISSHIIINFPKMGSQCFPHFH